MHIAFSRQIVSDNTFWSALQPHTVTVSRRAGCGFRVTIARDKTSGQPLALMRTDTESGEHLHILFESTSVAVDNLLVTDETKV